MLKGLVNGLVWYQPSDKELRQFGDGGVAIIDQWIAAHAKFFVGTNHPNPLPICSYIMQ